MRHHIYMKYFSIIHRFSIIFHIRKLKAFHLSGHQMGYVSCICNHPGTSQEQMASYLGLNKGAVAKGIRPLLKEGYIRRIQNEKDRRAYRLYPTEKSRELYAAAGGCVGRIFSDSDPRGCRQRKVKSFKAFYPGHVIMWWKPQVKTAGN